MVHPHGVVVRQPERAGRLHPAPASACKIVAQRGQRAWRRYFKRAVEPALVCVTIVSCIRQIDITPAQLDDLAPPQTGVEVQQQQRIVALANQGFLGSSHCARAQDDRI